MKEHHYTQLEEVDEYLIRKILKAHSKTPKESLYLETGLVPIRFIIKQRRLNYLHHLLTRDSEELINKVYNAQKRKMGKNDWAETVNGDLKEVKLDENSIMNLKKYQFKKIVKKKINEAAFHYLSNIQSTHSKVKDISYSKLEIQTYFLESKFSTKEKQLLFKLRTRMTNVKANFKSQYLDLTCDLCEKDFDQSDFHLLECERILNECAELSNDNSSEYEDIFGTATEQLPITKLYIKVFETKNRIESK